MTTAIKENNTLFIKIGLQKAEIVMLKALKTSQFCYFSYILVALRIKISAVFAVVKKYFKTIKKV